MRNLLFPVLALLTSKPLVSARRPTHWGLSTPAASAIYDPSRRQSSSNRLASSRKTKKAAVVNVVPEEPTPGPLANALMGGLVIMGTTAMEYATGFIGGYFLGTVVGIPGIFYSKQGLAVSKRFGNMNARSMEWARTWAPISAVFGGCDAATRVVRGNVKDQWNTVISSAVAGAYFSRKGGPVAMVRGAALYGGFTYVLSGGLNRSRQDFQYKEEALEF